MADVYDRGDGVPTPGKNLFPSSEGENPAFEPDATNGEIPTSKGGPATFSGTGDDTGVLNSSGYNATGELRAGAETGPGFDDIKHDV